MTKEKITELWLPYPDNTDRLIRVFVPAHEDGETFPVIYMTDGSNLFDEETCTFGCWHTRESVRAEHELSGQAAIIVGIHNDDSDQRTNELTPKSIGAILSSRHLEKDPVPLGEIFDDFTVNTVIPAVEAQFPVKKGRNNTAFCGSSSGGLEAFFTALSHPDKFCAAGVLSPAFLLYSEEDLRRWIYTKIQPEMPYLYIYTGAGDDLERDIYESVERTYDALLECYPMHLLNEIVLLDQKHHETAWEPVFSDFLHTFLTRRNEF